MFLKSGNTFHPFGMRYPEENAFPPTQHKIINILKKRKEKKKRNGYLIRFGY